MARPKPAGSQVKDATALNWLETASSSVKEQVQSSDTLVYNSSLTAITGVGPTASAASYVGRNSDGTCYKMELTSASLVLTGASGTTACPKD